MKEIHGLSGKRRTHTIPPSVRNLLSVESDHLSGILDSIRVSGFVAGLSTFSAPWGIRFEDGPSCFLVVIHGACELELDGHPSSVSIRAGDLLINVRGKGHCLRDDPQSPAVHIEDLLTSAQIQKGQGINFGGGGEITTMTNGCFLFDPDEEIPLLAALPPVVHIPGKDGRMLPWLEDILRLIAFEMGSKQPGTRAIISHLARIIFIQAVREYISLLPQTGGNWLDGMMDREIGPALGHIHLRPDLPWSVESLAREVGLSRSGFAAKFLHLVGQTPMKYLLHCRMHKACTLLKDGRNSIKEVANRIGYESVASFSNAFKRWASVSPGGYRLEQSSHRRVP